MAVGNTTSGYPKEPEPILRADRYAVESPPGNHEDLANGVVRIALREATPDITRYFLVVLFEEGLESRHTAITDRIGHYAILAAGLAMHLHGRVVHFSVICAKVQVRPHPPVRRRS